MNHLFRECPASVSVWGELACQTFLSEYHLEFPQWLVWVFEQSNSVQCRIFCCILWAIWGDKNARVHKKVSKSGKEIVSFVHKYILELNEIETRRPKVFPVVRIVARNSEGKVLLVCSEIHKQVASAFAAEAIACRRATQLGIDMKWKNIIIEGSAEKLSLGIWNRLKQEMSDDKIGRSPKRFSDRKELWH
ncbi:hypothetical protein Gotur_020135 [Gossypium turneri]